MQATFRRDQGGKSAEYSNFVVKIGSVQPSRGWDLPTRDGSELIDVPVAARYHHHAPTVSMLTNNEFEVAKHCNYAVLRRRNRG